MASVRWAADAPVTQMLAHRSPDGRGASYALQIHNPHARALAAHVRIDSQPTDSQHAYLDQTYAVAPGATQAVKLDHPACMSEETIYTRIRVSSADRARVYFHREFNWTLARKHTWDEAGETAGPLERIKRALTFHASFDKGPDADVARGDPANQAPRPAGRGFRQVEGLSGKAMLSGRDGASAAYANAKNLNIREGTLSMWIRPVDWQGPGQGDNNHTLFTNGIAGKGYFGVQMARQVSPGPYLCFYMIQYPWRKTAAIFATDEVPTWKSDAWHWVVLTWRTNEVSLYVDGQARGRQTLAPPLADRDLTSPVFRIGRPSGKEQTAIDEVMLFDRCLSPTELRTAKAFCRASAPDAWDAVDLKFAYYPYHGKLKAQVDINGLTGREQIRGATLAVRRIGGAEPVATVQMPRFVSHVSEVITDLPDLAQGEYQLALRLAGAPPGLKGELLRSFRRQRFKWEHNSIGKSDRILPPFTPIRVAGRTVSTVLRDHQMNAQGLWDQVVSKGKPILAAPIRFQAWRSGRPVALKTQSIEFTDVKPTHVTTQATWSAGDARGRVTSDIGYDGMMLCRLELWAGALDRLDLVIPLKDSMAPLAHLCGERCRANFAGYVPKGTGVVWDSSKSLKHEIVGPFTPYLWLGAEERGLCWFAETDRGWALDRTTPCQQIERNRGVLTLRVRLIQKPTRLDPPRRIRFCLQATPVKPMPERPANWRRWCAVNRPGAMHFTIAGSSLYAGHIRHDPFPYKRDVTVWQKLGECRRTGKVDRDFARAWVDRYPPELLKGPGREKYMRSVLAGQYMASRQPKRFLLYVQGRGVTFRTPEFQTFQDEWTHADYTTRVWPQGYRAGLSYTAGPVPSWQDYNLWWLKQQMETFSDGLYFDCFYILPYQDRVTSHAYRLPDGRIQPGLPILNMREMMKRTATMYIEADRHPMIGPHMTNSTLVPVMAFAQFGLDWEWHYGRQDFQDRWSRDHIRAACTGLQTGCAPVVIGIGAKGGSAEEVEWLHRTFNGVVLTHELIPVWYTMNRYLKPAERRKRRTSQALYYDIRELLFSVDIGTDACRTYNYWQSDYPLRANRADTSGIVHRGKGKAVIILTDWGKGGELRLALDAQRLRLQPGFRAVDFETGQPVSTDGMELAFTLKAHDFKTIVIEDAP